MGRRTVGVVSGPVAVIDLGTVSTRLLITGTDTRVAVVTRLGESVHRDGAFGASAWDRLAGPLDDFVARIRTHGVTDVRVVATSSARDATDREWFFDQVEGVVGHRPRLLDGETEARLTFAGATSALPAGHSVLLIDIGGGSTEYVLGRAGSEPTETWSADVGAGRLTDAYLESDPPRPEELSSALSIVEAHLSDVRVALPGLADVLADPNHVVIGVGGTITTTAAVEIGLADYDASVIDGFRLTRAAAEDVFRTLATEPLEDRICNPGLSADRGPVIVGGCCVLVETIRQFGIDVITVSDRDLLEGVAAEVR